MGSKQYKVSVIAEMLNISTDIFQDFEQNIRTFDNNQSPSSPPPLEGGRGGGVGRR